MQRRAALLAAALLGAASGLRLEAGAAALGGGLRSEGQPGPDVSLRRGGLPKGGAAAASENEGAAAKLPEPEVFEALWKGDLQKERRGAPFPREVQLVLGVFATEADDPRVREAIRRTWMDQPGVCMLEGGQRPNCSVYAAFVLGETSGEGYSKHEFVLNVSEAKNTGKTFYYFGHAAKSFPWATHIVKMDLDTFPYLGRLTESLREHMGSRCEHYFGKAVDWETCGRFNWCPPENCSTPVGGDFLKYGADDSQKCWSYMQGGFYGMSASLARNLTTPGGLWYRRRQGFEDLTAGRVVGSYAREKNICVSTWNPLAWDHIGALSSIKKVEFSNGTVVWKHRNSALDE